MDTMMLKHELEALLMAADAPLPLERLCKLLENEAGLGPGRDAVRAALAELTSDYAGRGVELCEGAGGYRFRTRAAHAERVSRLWEERKPRYSRALLETLALIAYRQPITRGEIEHVRGVAVSSNIMRLLLEREWVRVVGHRDVPGRPAVYATTREFLDYFGLRSLAELPSLAELKDFDAVNADLFANVVLDAAARDAASMISSEMSVDETPAAAVEQPSSESDRAQAAS